MKIYHYDEAGCYTQATEARLSPLDNAPLVPARATLIAPPAPAENKVAKFDEAEDTWSQIPDYRSRQYWTATGGLTEITEAGVSPPANATELTAGQKLIKKGDAWRVRTAADDLAEAKEQKIAGLKSKTETAIKSGFESSALGAKHGYDSEQHNVDWIQAGVLSAQTNKITCDDLKGTATSKQPRDHTEAQCKQVLKDGMSALLTRKTKFRSLRAQVQTATTVAAVEAISW